MPVVSISCSGRLCFVPGRRRLTRDVAYSADSVKKLRISINWRWTPQSSPSVFESGDIGAMTVSWGPEKNTKITGRSDRIFGPKGAPEGSQMENFQWKGCNLYHDAEVSFHAVPQKDMFVEEINAFVGAIDGHPLHRFTGLTKEDRCSA
jgi:hypothetical protein